MSGISLSTKGIICKGNNAAIATGGGYYREEIQIEKPHINVIKVKTNVSTRGINFNELENIKFEVKKVLTTY